MSKVSIVLLMIVMLLSGCNTAEGRNDYKKDNYFLNILRTETEIHSYKKSNTIDISRDYEVYITKTGECYHKENCRYLHNSSVKISLHDATSKDYRQCSVCFSDN